MGKLKHRVNSLLSSMRKVLQDMTTVGKRSWDSWDSGWMALVITFSVVALTLILMLGSIVPAKERAAAKNQALCVAAAERAGFNEMAMLFTRSAYCEIIVTGQSDSIYVVFPQGE